MKVTRHGEEVHQRPRRPWKARLHEILFEAGTRAGKLFDVALLILIVTSIVLVMLESVDSIDERYGHLLRKLEWIITILFTIEYALRIISVRRPLSYIFSVYGLIDLVAILPTYLSAFVPGGRNLVVFRALRLLRVFRVLKLARFVGEAQALRMALRESSRKIIIFLFTLIAAVVIIGTLMYLIEGPENGFTNIPESVYWAIVTMTTVGFGDITPQTPVGKFLASCMMILGYGIIAVPTGIVSAEMAVAKLRQPVSTEACPSCSKDGHDPDARHCKFCGADLEWH